MRGLLRQAKVKEVIPRLSTMNTIQCDLCKKEIFDGKYCILSSRNAGYDFSKDICLDCIVRVEAVFEELSTKAEVHK